MTPSREIPKEGTCSLCGGHYDDYGHNPAPLGTLRDELDWLRGRHDGGAVSLATYNVVKALETEIAWRARHSRSRRCNASDR